MANRRQRRERAQRRKQHGQTAIPLADHLLEIVAGKRPMPVVEAKFQHYIPQMQLRGFSPEPEPHKDARVWQLDKERGVIDYSRVDRTGGGHRFNRIAHEDEAKRDAVEGFLSVIESYAAPALERMIRERTAPTKAERFAISMYVGMLGARTPRALDAGQTMNSMALDLYWGAMTQDRDWFRSLFKDVETNASDDELEQARRRLQEPGSVKYPEPRSAAFETTFRSAGDTAGLAVMMDWTLLVGKTRFILGDHPVTHYDPEPTRFPWTEPAWTTTPSTETTIALSSDTALMMTRGHRGFSVREAPEEEVTRLNLRTYGWASRFVFARAAAELETIQEQAKQRPDEVPRASRLYQVVMAPADGFLPHEPNEKPDGWPSYVLAQNDDGEMERCRYWPVPSDRPEEMREAAEWAARAVKRSAERRALRLAGTRRSCGDRAANPVRLRCQEQAEAAPL